MSERIEIGSAKLWHGVRRCVGLIAAVACLAIVAASVWHGSTGAALVGLFLFPIAIEAGGGDFFGEWW